MKTDAGGQRRLFGPVTASSGRDTDSAHGGGGYSYDLVACLLVLAIPERGRMAASRKLPSCYFLEAKAAIAAGGAGRS